MKKNTDLEVYTYSISGWKKNIKGVQLSENEELICFLKNPVDFVLDGLVFLNRKMLSAAHLEPNELLQQVFKFKVENLLKKNGYGQLGFKDYKDLFSYLKKNKVFCELALSKENIIYIGEIIEVHQESIDVDFFDTNFMLLDNAYIKYDDIKSITIFSDYVDTYGKYILSLR